MRLMLFGASNVLGKQIARLADDVICATRERVEYTSPNSLHEFLEANACDMIVNASALSQSLVSDMVLVNSYFPHILSSIAYPTPVTHISSDAVFSGHSRFKNSVESIIDPTTYYGKSRALGEVLASNVCVVRASYVGLESGMVRWLLSQKPGATIEGWVNYKWSGSTVDEAARRLIEMLNTWQPGICHLATQESISKYDLALALIRKLGLDLKLTPVYHPIINRALVPTHALMNLEEALYANSGSFDLQAQPA